VTATSDIPIHQSLSVVDSESIYRTEEWWKAVVRYRFNEDDEYDETAVYLWHDDDGWTRKNKYVIKTDEAWKTDKTLIDRLLADEDASQPDRNLPVSDYYEIGAGETVFRSDGWWKAIVKIVQKGSYETEEIMVYLWQQTDGDWRRRQKYTIKDEESWQEEIAAVEAIIDSDSTAADTTQDTGSQQEGTETQQKETVGQISEFDQLNREIDKHLSEARSE